MVEGGEDFLGLWGEAWLGGEALAVDADGDRPRGSDPSSPISCRFGSESICG